MVCNALTERFSPVILPCLLMRQKGSTVTKEHNPVHELRRLIDTLNQGEATLGNIEGVPEGIEFIRTTLREKDERMREILVPVVASLYALCVETHIAGIGHEGHPPLYQFSCHGDTSAIYDFRPSSREKLCIGKWRKKDGELHHSWDLHDTPLAVLLTYAETMLPRVTKILEHHFREVHNGQLDTLAERAKKLNALFG